jgi:hypothetical protein
MTSLIVSLALALSVGSTGQHQAPCPHCQGGVTQPMPPGPGYGWGFRNGNPDGYGFWDAGTYLPIGADRTSDYFFRRYYSVPADQMFLPNYFNPYLTRGQRYVSYAGCGGEHPAGGPPMGSANTPVNPYQDTIGSGPRVAIPPFSGRVEAAPINSGGTGLTP